MPFTQPKQRQKGWLLVILASVLLLLLAAAQGYVSWQAQYTFIYAAKHAQRASVLEALGLDTAAVIFALLGLAHARMGQSAAIERALNLACVGGSLVMNLLGANLGSPRSIAVYVLPAVLYAGCSDRLIAVAGHASGVQETSMWRTVGRTFLYFLRFAVAFPSTAKGMRYRLLELTPLPETRIPAGTPRGELEAPKERDGYGPGTRTRQRHRKHSKAPAGIPVRRPIEEILEEVPDKYADELKSGTVPGIREIRDRSAVGQDRAGVVQQHLTNLVQSRDEPSGATQKHLADLVQSHDDREKVVVTAPEPDDDDTVVFRSPGHPSPGQDVSSYQLLPITPGGR